MEELRNEDHSILRENFRWGSFGRNGDEPKQVRFIKDLTPDHIFNILKTQTHLNKEQREMFVEELVYRLEN
jgi:hypothetical protein